MDADQDSVVLKHLAEKTEIKNIAELKSEKHDRKVFEALLEIDRRRFDVIAWNEACAYFMGQNKNYITVDEARHGLMSFMNKERCRSRT